MSKQQTEQRLKIAQEELNKVKIETEQEIKLKEEENRICGRHRDLTATTELSRLKVYEAEAKLNLALLSVKRLEQKIKATQIYSPVDGKVISVQVQHSTVTLRILAQSSFSQAGAELSLPDSSESSEDEPR